MKTIFLLIFAIAVSPTFAEMDVKFQKSGSISYRDYKATKKTVIQAIEQFAEDGLKKAGAEIVVKKFGVIIAEKLKEPANIIATKNSYHFVKTPNLMFKPETCSDKWKNNEQTSSTQDRRCFRVAVGIDDQQLKNELLRFSGFKFKFDSPISSATRLKKWTRVSVSFNAYLIEDEKSYSRFFEEIDEIYVFIDMILQDGFRFKSANVKFNLYAMPEAEILRKFPPTQNSFTSANRVFGYNIHQDHANLVFDYDLAEYEREKYIFALFEEDN